MKIYFSGIAGSGIGPLAEIALDAGYEIVGSDPAASPFSEELSKRGVVISQNQDGSFLEACHNDQPIDWLIYTSALPKDHPELAMAQKLGIKTSKRDEFLAKIIKDKNLKLLAIAGTHGKTTTASMLTFTLQKLNIPVSYLIGAKISFGPSGKFDPNSEYFVYECDEYDRNFLNFEPYISAITSLDYDHADTYPTSGDYIEAFRKFANNSKRVIAWKNQHGEIVQNIPQSILLDDSDINQSIKLAGIHNRRNATIVQKILQQINIEAETDDILSSYPGASRRFEKLADNLYTDYGHHPSEIAATLELASELSNHVVLVYQPHQNIRQHQLYRNYTDQFKRAEIIHWLPTYLTRENPNLRVLTPRELTANIENKQSIRFSDLNGELWKQIKNYRDEGKLVVVMGAGTIDDWARDKVASENPNQQ